MRCRRCGRKAGKGEAFCGECGAPLPRRRRWPVVAGAVAAAAVIACVAAAVLLRGGGGSTVTPDGGLGGTTGEPLATTTLDGVDTSETDAWVEDFLARSDVREQMRASDEGACLTEAQAWEALSARGFDPSAAWTNYELDGSYHDDAAISEGSATAHPAYTLLYASAGGEYWSVTIYGDCVTASPLSRNLQEGAGTVLLSEQEGIVSYDSKSRTLYRLVPPADELTVRHVDGVSAAYLDGLTAEEVSAL